MNWLSLSNMHCKSFNCAFCAKTMCTHK